MQSKWAHRKIVSRLLVGMAACCKWVTMGLFYRFFFFFLNKIFFWLHETEARTAHEKVLSLAQEYYYNYRTIVVELGSHAACRGTFKLAVFGPYCADVYSAGISHQSYTSFIMHACCTTWNWLLTYLLRGLVLNCSPCWGYNRTQCLIQMPKAPKPFFSWNFRYYATS